MSRAIRSFAAETRRAPFVERALLPLVFILACAAACGSSDEKPPTKGTGGTVGVAGATGAGGATPTGGTGAGGSSGAGGDPSICHPSNFSTAPPQCLQAWVYATAKYPAKCKMDGGYQAHCDPYDAILYDSADTSVECFYETSTGNLVGARSTMNGSSTCVAFDTSFAEPDRAACVPGAGGC